MNEIKKDNSSSGNKLKNLEKVLDKILAGAFIGATGLGAYRTYCCLKNYDIEWATVSVLMTLAFASSAVSILSKAYYDEY